MTVSDRIRQKLTRAFAPLALEVLDESERHAGHAGYRPGGESHFRIAISAEAFRGKSRIERHRMINELLREELNSGVHAVAIRALAPGENGGT
jgi:BolA family transcriptional regulator, general stress-responsive regulator